jgi:hydrogenase nickel incorporation protein HypB
MGVCKMANKEIVVREEILGSNKKVAAEIREKLEAAGVLVVNLLSSPGSGKTTLLERIVETLEPAHPLAVIEGDIETERDAERIRRKGVPAWQITTGGACHLEARMVGRLIGEIPARTEFLFIENVGNLVCPASYDLGENLRCVLLSAPEGDDKPKKYPKAFASADCLIITKSDLIPHVPFDLEKAGNEALDINPRLRIFVTSALKGKGIAELVCYFIENRDDMVRRNRHA